MVATPMNFIPATEATEAAPKPHVHIPALDAVRGLAIVLVTMYRFAGAGVDTSQPGMALFKLFKPLDIGVDLFFVLSGFLITGILVDSKSKPHYFSHFFARRSLRIFPLYFGVLIGVFLLLPLVSNLTTELFPSAQEKQGWLWLYGANILIGWTSDWMVLDRFGHFWSLAVEEHFYLVWPFVIYALSRKQAMRACAILSVASMLARGYYTYKFGEAANVGAETFTWMRLDCLALGGWGALAARGPQGLPGMHAKAWVLGAIGLGTILLMVAVGRTSILNMSMIVYALFFMSFILVMAQPEPVMGFKWLGNNRVLHFFGKYSYGMYVFQNLLIPVVAPVISAAILAEKFGSLAAGQLAYLVVMFGLTTLAALASWHLYEKHFLKLKKYVGG